VGSYEEECLREESRFHYLHCLQGIINVAIKRVNDEVENKFEKKEEDGSVVSSYKELYTSKVKQQEDLCKDLRTQQKKIKESFEPNLKQMSMFTDLQKLLKCKADLQTKASQEALMGIGDTYGDTNIFTMQHDDQQAFQMDAGMQGQVMG